MSPSPTTLSPLPPLRVALNLSAPWAFAEDLTLDGIDVARVRKYAALRGRVLRWLDLGGQPLADALARGEVDLAVGGLAATPELAAAAHLAPCASEAMLGDDAPVWAVSHRAGDEWRHVRDFLAGVITPAMSAPQRVVA